MTEETPRETTLPTAPARIDPKTDPVKNILDKVYDGALKYLLSNTVTWRVKAATLFALYTAISGAMGYFNNSQKPSEDLNEATLRSNVDQFITTRNIGGQCFYEDKSRRLQVLFTEKSAITTVTDILTSIATITAYTPQQTERLLGTLPLYIAAPCDELNPATRLDANKVGMHTQSAVNDFMNTLRQSKALESAGTSKGYYSIRTIPFDGTIVIATLK